MTHRSVHYMAAFPLFMCVVALPARVNATSLLCENLPLTIKERVDSVDAVFLGQVIATVEKEVPRPDCLSDSDAVQETTEGGPSRDDADTAASSEGLSTLVNDVRQLEDQYRRIACEHSPDKLQLVAFDVLRAWKGVASTKADGLVRAGQETSDTFVAAGERWLVFGNREGSFVRVSSACASSVLAESPTGKDRVAELDALATSARPRTDDPNNAAP